jgi:NAD+ kinase
MPDQTVSREQPLPHRVHRIGLLYARGIDAARDLAVELENWLKRLGIDVWRGCADDHCVQEGEAIAACDLLFTLGGDGTALRGARVAAPLQVPLVCVGLGRLSFMAELTPEGVLKELPSFLAGDYWLEQRAMLEGIILREGRELARCLALNEVVLGRERCATALQVAARVNGAYLTTYVGDAVIVATATGSTAYALSVGGPILAPESENIVLVPVAAHLCLLPPMVLPAGVEIELEVVRGFSAGVNCDGQSLSDLRAQDIVRVYRSQACCYFARLQGRDYFYRTLKERLYRGDY